MKGSPETADLTVHHRSYRKESRPSAKGGRPCARSNLQGRGQRPGMTRHRRVDRPLAAGIGARVRAVRCRAELCPARLDRIRRSHCLALVRIASRAIILNCTIRIGKLTIAAIVNRSARCRSRCAISLHAAEHPITVLVEQNDAITAFDIDGSPIVREDAEKRLPGLLATFESQPSGPH